MNTNQNIPTTVQENGSSFKLVFSHWYNYNGETCPISNGLHPAFVSYVQTLTDPALCRTHLRIQALDATFQNTNSGYLFRHGNFIWHFCRVHTDKNLITEDQVINDGSVYYFPIEIEMGGMQALCHPREFSVGGQSYIYHFKDSITPTMLAMLQSGKVKLLITNLIDASVIKGKIDEFEKIIKDIGIDSKNVVFAQGNNLNYVYEYNPECKIKMVSGMISLFQAAYLFNRYPFYDSELGYDNDLFKPEDFNANKIRPKKFLCFNRTMDRPHRIAMAYIAMKYDLLKDGIFTFVTNLTNWTAQELAKIYPDEDTGAIAAEVHKLVPYEIDTQHLPMDRKQGFGTVGINKKEWYENSYLHIVSESSFNESIDPFFSEKTWRPIMNLQPFIFVGNVNSLSKLKKLGFKTFSPYIDESYDRVQDSRQRFLMIEKEIKKFADMPIEEIHEWYYSIVNILIHNQNHLRTFTNYDPYEELYK